MNEKLVLEKWKEYFEIKTEKDYVSLYVHIPYCETKCKYCMHSLRPLDSQEQIDSYLDFLEKETNSYIDVFNNNIIDSVYIGGGTPSLLNLVQLKKLFFIIGKFNINISLDNMHSFEANPSSLTKEKIDFLHSTFINRISIGVQSLSEKVILSENRPFIQQTKILDLIKYSIEKFSDKYSRINVDLMFGLNNQTEDIAIKDFNTIIETGVNRITLYANHQIREKNEKKKFESGYTEYLNKLKYSGYNFYGSKEKYSGVSFVTKLNSKPFKKWYNTQPYLYNNCLGLGYWAYSWIIPNKFFYTKLSDKFILEANRATSFDKLTHFQTDKIFTHRHLDNSEYETQLNNFHF